MSERAHAGKSRSNHSECGSELWSLKTLSDPQRFSVRLRPTSTTVAAINARPMPSPTPTTRSTPYERRVWQVRAQLVEFKLEADGDIHLALFDKGQLHDRGDAASGMLALNDSCSARDRRGAEPLRSSRAAARVGKR
jgi:hypothetical protein